MTQGARFAQDIATLALIVAGFVWMLAKVL